MPTLRILFLRFPSLPLRPRDLPKFRAGVCESAGLEADIFHNHADGERRGTMTHRPALIQYRVAQGCACVWGMGAGAVALERWWLSAPDVLHFGGQSWPIHAAEVRREHFELDMTTEGEWKYYRLHDYLALNTENFRQWVGTPQLGQRVALLETALTGHLLGFCQAADWWLPQRLEVQLVDIHDRRKTRYHDTELMKFELTYRCNILLPEGMALGKAVSHGFGVQWPAPRFEQAENAVRHSRPELAQVLMGRDVM